MKIAVVGAGYVGLSNAILLAQHHEVYLIDIIQDKIDKIISGFLLLQIKKSKNIFPVTRCS